MKELVTSPFISVLPRKDSKVTLFNSLNGRSLEVGNSVVKILKFFDQKGRTIHDFRHHFVSFNTDSLNDVIEDLIAKQILFVSENLKESLSTLKQYGNTLFQLDHLKSEEAGKICIVGIPYGKGNPLSIGQQSFPNILRSYSDKVHISFKKSLVEHINFRALDQLDYDLLLKSIIGDKLRDAGNLFINSNESDAFVYEKMEIIAQRLIAKRHIPVFIGGDHSISYPLIKTVSKHYRKINVIHFDAHTDTYTTAYDQIVHSSTRHHHANFMHHCLQLKEVENVYQFGIRGFENLQTQSTKKQHIYYASELLDVMHENRVKLPLDEKYYVTFDIDFINPLWQTNTATPVFGGLDLKSTVLFLRKLLSGLNIVGIDFVEGNSEVSGDSSTTAVPSALYVLLNLINLIKGA